MGACDVSGKFKDYSWKRGIRQIQDDAEAYYGHQEGYSGAENCCSFSFGGSCADMSKKELDKFIDKRMDELYKGHGEVLKGKIVEYAIIETEIVETLFLSFDSRSYLRNMKKGPALLVKLLENGYPRLMKEGTVADLKKYAHRLLREDKYNYEYFIIGKTKTYSCRGKVKYQKLTKKQTDEKHLVLPVYEFYYYGIAPC